MPAPSLSGFNSPAWLPGAHLQTIFVATLAPRGDVTYERQRWQTPDGDFIDVDFVRPDGEPKGLVALFHGLEGNSSSQYALSVMRQTKAAGLIGCVPHFRGCSGEPNLAPRAYHSGDSREIHWILERLAQDYPLIPRYAAGVSLGGNALLKWAGEQGESASELVRAVAGISAPQDLRAGASALSRGFSRIYAHNFFKTLRAKCLIKLEQHPGLINREQMLRANDFFAYDDAVTARMHGFHSCFDYWERSSSKQFLPAIRVPTLVFNARNDPFLPARHLAQPEAVSSAVQLAYPDTGGHVGFLNGSFPGRIDWLGENLVHWFHHG
ncbi:MAG: YheT family hydrolase [Burkholderiaceae bacterium]